MKNYNVSDEPVTEVAVDINDIKDTSKEKGRNEECVFLVAGRMIYRKGLDFLFDALLRIPQGTRYQVRIVGDGPELEHLRKRCKDNLNLSEHVHCMGSIPYMEMEKEYSDADVFIMPSIRETTGTVLLEAMSKGIPVITINKFGGATLFDNDTGWLYEGNTKEEYIENGANFLFLSVYFVIGGVLYLYKDYIQEKVSRIPTFVVLLATAVITMVWYFIPANEFSLFFTVKTSILFAIWVIFAISQPMKLLENSVTKTLSQVSLEVYLSHMMIFRVVEKFGIAYRINNGNIAYIVVLSLTIIITIVFALIAKRVIDICFRRLKKAER